MKEALKASADWYFDGPGWLIMTILVAPLIGYATNIRPRFWWPVFAVVVAIIPFILLAIRWK